MGFEEHKQIVQDHHRPVQCAVVTVSDSRDKRSDKSGALVRSALIDAGHLVVDYRIVKDEADLIREAVVHLAGSSDCQAILLNGGTGIARRDVTHEVVSELLDKKLDGFGELFRFLSYEEIGPAAMLSRAVAGLRGDRLIVAMPGSTAACRLAMEKLVLPELNHLVWEASK